MIAPAVLSLGAGTYANGGGQGLRTIRCTDGGEWVPGEDYAAAPNASFSVYSARYGLHYIVDEQEAGRVGVHRHDATGWAALASVPTGGAGPCHVALDRTETLLAVANYGSGSVSLLHLDERSGLFAGAVQHFANHGSGPNPQRQEAPHAHWVGFSPDRHWLYQTDLGTDQVLAFPIDRRGTLGAPHTAYAAPPGSGPRHLLLHPRLPGVAYLASELASTLTLLDRDGGALRRRDVLSTLPEGWRGDNIVAHLALNRAGDRLYVSNRGHESIAVFALDAGGRPTLLQHASAGGASPRFFLLLEEQRLVMVANEKAQTVTQLAIESDGRLTPRGAPLAIPGVAYLLMPEPAAFHRHG